MRNRCPLRTQTNVVFFEEFDKSGKELRCSAIYIKKKQFSEISKNTH